MGECLSQGRRVLLTLQRHLIVSTIKVHLPRWKNVYANTFSPVDHHLAPNHQALGGL